MLLTAGIQEMVANLKKLSMATGCRNPRTASLVVSGPGPCGIPENTGIPGFDSNTDTGIFENKIPVFFGIFV